MADEPQTPSPSADAAKAEDIAKLNEGARRTAEMLSTVYGRPQSQLTPMDVREPGEPLVQCKVPRKFAIAHKRGTILVLAGNQPLPKSIAEHWYAKANKVEEYDAEAENPEATAAMRAQIESELRAKIEAETREKIEAEQRDAANRMKTDPETGLRLDGPTMEEYVKAGYKPENYPPKGYAEVDSPALKEHKAKVAAVKTTGGADEPPPPPPADGEAKPDGGDGKAQGAADGPKTGKLVKKTT